LFGFFLFLHRAGHKLEGAIEQLGVDVAGKVALDSGLSTGGFTDCLLQYGASHVYGVDVGYGQVTYITLHYFLGYFGRDKVGVKVT
jgi:predicted rRNA methylase YqxC with S4 and FtsJ domains